ncbi:uncharacterized ACR, YagE family COG1723 domain-containing protein, putative [Eimeria tenella]|uniref:Uncharacterized ACR, YagE family COG1723 domain-containing protein, putative n=1 Tax=Eimeria tenella TaxID=5802 RepID=U6KXS3_EIMTE|nr:uncharacterized ACR, YagE family COG1723 domain-containing protein, putative [Eimeria tenella]CDJ42927.1 uncharacterized ACR, YagE family COG1723 domain-containing protein, putative [Eimeria tenella]|eukprot:XP_013233677.1 uncharacterized ACR, YagE family COG1723 domain-containing protein, putative [Eimeria tenella]
MQPLRDMEPSGHYQQITEPPQVSVKTQVDIPPDSDPDFSSAHHAMVPTQQRKPIRSTKKRADIQASIRERADRPTPAGCVWAVCIGAEVLFTEILKAVKRPDIIRPKFLKVENTYSEVLFCKCFVKRKTVFVFRFGMMNTQKKEPTSAAAATAAATVATESARCCTGNNSKLICVLAFACQFVRLIPGCIVAWDIDVEEQKALVAFMQPYLKEPLGANKEDDTMTYVWSDRATIKGDNIHLVTTNVFECLAYSYAFAQSVKLAFFETLVDADIERTKMIPESLARTGNIQSTREDIGRRIGELFVNRFYINLHTDILDTPDIFWDNDDFADHYDHCRRYLEIPKRVEILNQRLDIIKDLYDMLNNELTIQHGYKLEWIVIYLICIEVLIEVVWNILIKDVLKWV